MVCLLLERIKNTLKFRASIQRFPPYFTPMAIVTSIRVRPNALWSKNPIWTLKLQCARTEMHASFLLTKNRPARRNDYHILHVE